MPTWCIVLLLAFVLAMGVCLAVLVVKMLCVCIIELIKTVRNWRNGR
jgi:hypothetical protein